MRFPNRSTMPVALALACGTATSVMLYGFLVGSRGAEAAQMAQIVVARVAVDDRRALAPEDLAVVEAAWSPPGAYARPADLVGRMPLVAVPMGQPLLSSHLAPAGAGPGLWHRVPKGMRAVAVAINEVVGVGGFLKPGLKVDVIGVAQTGLGWESATIAQNVPILAIAQDAADRKEDTEARVATSTTLLVNPAQAEAISLASEKGRIRLVLRAPDDDVVRAIPKPRPAKTQAPASRPQPQPAAPRVVERTVYREAPQRAAPPAPRPVAPPPGIQVIRGKHVEVVTP